MSLPPLLILYLALGVVQIFLAGLGVFSLDGQELGSADETAFEPHRFVGTAMSAVALLIVIAAAVARPGRRFVIMSVTLLLLLSVVQSVLAAVGEDTALLVVCTRSSATPPSAWPAGCSATPATAESVGLAEGGGGG